MDLPELVHTTTCRDLVPREEEVVTEGKHLRMGSMSMPAPAEHVSPHQQQPPCNTGFAVRSQSLHSVGGGEEEGSPTSRKQPPPKPRRDPNTKLSISSEAVDLSPTKGDDSERFDGTQGCSEDCRKVPPPKPKRNPNTQLSTSFDESNFLNHGSRGSPTLPSSRNGQAPSPPQTQGPHQDMDEPVYIEMSGNAAPREPTPHVEDDEPGEAVYEEMKYPALDEYDSRWDLSDYRSQCPTPCPPEVDIHAPLSRCNTPRGMSLCDIPAPFPNLLSHRPPLLVFPPAPAQCSPNSDESPLTPLDMAKIPTLDNSSYSKSPTSSSLETSASTSHSRRAERELTATPTLTVSGRSSAPPLSCALYKSSSSSHAYQRSHSACPSPVSMGRSLTPLSLMRSPPFDGPYPGAGIPRSASATPHGKGESKGKSHSSESKREHKERSHHSKESKRDKDRSSSGKSHRRNSKNKEPNGTEAFSRRDSKDFGCGNIEQSTRRDIKDRGCNGPELPPRPESKDRGCSTEALPRRDSKDRGCNTAEPLLRRDSKDRGCNTAEPLHRRDSKDRGCNTVELLHGWDSKDRGCNTAEPLHRRDSKDRGCHTVEPSHRRDSKDRGCNTAELLHRRESKDRNNIPEVLPRKESKELLRNGLDTRWDSKEKVCYLIELPPRHESKDVGRTGLESRRDSKDSSRHGAESIQDKEKSHGAEIRGKERITNGSDLMNRRDCKDRHSTESPKAHNRDRSGSSVTASSSRSGRCTQCHGCTMTAPCWSRLRGNSDSVERSEPISGFLIVAHARKKAHLTCPVGKQTTGQRSTGRPLTLLRTQSSGTRPFDLLFLTNRNNQYSLAVVLPREECNHQGTHSFGDSPQQIRRGLSSESRLYKGYRVIAARPMFNDNLPTDHAEYRLLTNEQGPSLMSELLNRWQAYPSCTVFFTLNSPCGAKCTNTGHLYNILQYLDIFDNRNPWVAFVFQDIFNHELTHMTRAEMLLLLQRIHVSGGNIPVFRCPLGGDVCVDCMADINPETNQCLQGMPHQ
ncbi:Neuronal tyrosine-phosphorylated phosphoinositide-3-kinase adapter 2 [Triplophysa tibetana]|uniref:Neuronal tyrosine-phosphorylated phosphoinositide-3-kinase adapter 2 n=1 Tax=Triplophysa tibetana TaxID=1572043 RepID=A0A5A9PB55_9TELE|nr:Neuronal tyrosine-phosphorylated phosphoinositide-3-kinase adapter 2 [Triplophysa tibetana]